MSKYEQIKEQSATGLQHAIEQNKLTEIAVDFIFLAHLSRRLTGELIVYPCSGVRRRSQFQRSSSLKRLG